MTLRIIWRFFVDPEGRWRWQQVSDARILIAESRNSYASYDDVVHAAQAAGYVYQASQANLKHLRSDGIPRR
jgi:hypothetical protein